MTPEQISIITALAAILDKIGGWPLSTLIPMAILGPWIVLIVVAITLYRQYQGMKQMYENNVALVKAYDKISCEQQDVIIMNTTAVTELTTIVKERIK